MAAISASTIRKLHAVLRKGTVDDLQNLLNELPTNFDLCTLRTKSDQTPLHTTISHHASPSNLVNLLLMHKHRPNVRGCFTQNITPLHQACQRGDIGSVQALLRHNADVEMVKRGDWTALMLSCGGRFHGTSDNVGAHCSIVRELLHHNARIERVNLLKETAMHLAARTCARCLALLAQHGGHCAGWRTRNGRTALHYAAYTANVEAIQGLLCRESAAVVGAVDGGGMNVWHQIAASNARRSAEAMAVVCGFDEGGFWETDVAGFNALHHAGCSGNEGVVREGIRSGRVSLKNVGRVDAAGCTAVDVAQAHGHDDVAHLLNGLRCADIR